MDKNFDAVLCQLKYGRKGSLLVNGKEFNQPMPGVRSLTELEIAEIATYIYNTWEHHRGRVEVAEVTEALGKCQP
jgi:mono/diheme cytochrome c family protein